MTPDEEHTVDTAGGQRPAVPAMCGVFMSPSPQGSRRRIELHDLFAAVIPDGEVPGAELWMGEGDPRPPLHYDVELLQALQAEGFTGYIWSELSDRLARYGLGVIGAWITSGEIFDRTKKKIRPVKPPDPPFTSDERTALAIDTVAEGLKLFQQKGLLDHDWDPSRGARLSTYFVGSCVLCFANLCRKQVVARNKTNLDVFATDEYDPDWGSSAPSAERVALGRIGLRTIMKGDVPEDVVNLVVTYSVLGYKSNEIAELINNEHTTYSSSAVRLMLSKYRKTFAEGQHEGGQHARNSRYPGDKR